MGPGEKIRCWGGPGRRTAGGEEGKKLGKKDPGVPKSAHGPKKDSTGESSSTGGGDEGGVHCLRGPGRRHFWGRWWVGGVEGKVSARLTKKKKKNKTSKRGGQRPSKWRSKGVKKGPRAWWGFSRREKMCEGTWERKGGDGGGIKKDGRVWRARVTLRGEGLHAIGG